MQTISAILSVLTALLTYLWRSDHWDSSPWGLFCILADFPSQVMLLFYVVRDHVYSSLESGWKWHRCSNSSHKPSSACSFFCFWPSSGLFGIGQDSQLPEGAVIHLLFRRKYPETEHEVGCKHFSCIELGGELKRGGEQAWAVRRWWGVPVGVRGASFSCAKHVEDSHAQLGETDKP